MTPDSLRLAARFRTTLELHEAGVQMMRLNLRRRYPGESDAEIEGRVVAWLTQRDDDVPPHHRRVSWPRS